MYLFTGGKESVAVRLPPTETRQPLPIITRNNLTSSFLAVKPTSLFTTADFDPLDIKVNLPRCPPSRSTSCYQSYQKRANGGMLFRPAPISTPVRPRLSGPIARRDNEWKTWLELRLKIVGVPPDITTQELWACFSRYGTVSQIEIMEDSRGTRDGIAKVTYSPTPLQPFWQIDPFFLNQRHGTRVPVKIYLEPQRRTFLHPSPVDPSVKYPEVMTLLADSLDFGFMYDQQTMMTMHTISDGKAAGLRFKQSMLHRETVVEFHININGRLELFRFSIPFAHLDTIHRVNPNNGEGIELLVTLPSPPRFFRKLDEKDTHDAKARYWAERDSWYRQTDITHDPTALKTCPIALKKQSPVIDIGRWTTYRLIFNKTQQQNELFGRIGQALRI